MELEEFKAPCIELNQAYMFITKIPPKSFTKNQQQKQKKIQSI